MARREATGKDAVGRILHSPNVDFSRLTLYAIWTDDLYNPSTDLMRGFVHLKFGEGTSSCAKSAIAGEYYD